MAAWWAALSWLKLIRLESFATGPFVQYYPLAIVWKGFGYVFPFIELSFACLMASGFCHWGLTLVIVVTYVLDAGGVIAALCQGKALKCGCMGAISLPLTGVTVAEDIMMIAMMISMDHELLEAAGLHAA